MRFTQTVNEILGEMIFEAIADSDILDSQDFGKFKQNLINWLRTNRPGASVMFLAEINNSENTDQIKDSFIKFNYSFKETVAEMLNDPKF